MTSMALDNVNNRAYAGITVTLANNTSYYYVYSLSTTLDQPDTFFKALTTDVSSAEIYEEN